MPRKAGGPVISSPAIWGAPFIAQLSHAMSGYSHSEPFVDSAHGPSNTHPRHSESGSPQGHDGSVGDLAASEVWSGGDGYRDAEQYAQCNGRGGGIHG